MGQQRLFSNLLKIFGVICLIVLIVLVAGLFSVNYTNGVAIVVGIIISLALNRFLKFVKWRKLLILILLIPCLLVLFIGFIIFRFGPLEATKPPPCPFLHYRVVAMPETPHLDSIKIQQLVTLDNNVSFTPPSTWAQTYIDNQPAYRLPDIEATIDQRGFLLKEVSFQSSSVWCNITEDVELDDFPLNSFYAAHDAQDLQRHPYIDTETITWGSLSSTITFSYITPPFQEVRALLTPVLGASSLNQWLIGIIGMVGTLIFSPIVKPVLTDNFQKSIKDSFSKLAARITRKKAVKRKLK